MKVILLQDIKGIGRRFDIKEVKDGYARNFLLPKNLAEPAAPQALRRLMEAKEKHAAEREKKIDLLKEETKGLENAVFGFKLPTGEKGSVFGSVTARDIENELRERGIRNVRVEIDKPLKTLGEHEIQIDLGEGLKTKIKILIESAE